MVFIKLGLLSSVPCQRTMIAVPCRICKAPQIRKRRLLGMHLEPLRGLVVSFQGGFLHASWSRVNWLSTLFWGIFVYSYSNILTKISCEPTSFAFRELNYISFEQYFCSESRVFGNSSHLQILFSVISLIISVSSLKKKLSTKQTHHETRLTQQAFKKLLRDWHPDKNADRVQVCTAVFQFLQKARHLFKSERRWLDWPENDLSSDLVTLVICC